MSSWLLYTTQQLKTRSFCLQLSLHFYTIAHFLFIRGCEQQPDVWVIESLRGKCGREACGLVYNFSGTKPSLAPPINAGRATEKSDFNLEAACYLPCPFKATILAQLLCLNKAPRPVFSGWITTWPRLLTADLNPQSNHAVHTFFSDDATKELHIGRKVYC